MFVEFAGTFGFSGDGSPATSAQLSFPFGVAEGYVTLLGRSTTDQRPTAITMASDDSIATPFGAIDTSAQGATVSVTSGRMAEETPD